MKVIEQTGISQSLIDCRKNNLKKYILEKFNGNNTAFAKAVDKNVNQINLFLTDNEKFFRAMGERVARSMEQSLGLQEGFFDKPTDISSPKDLYSLSVRYQNDKGKCAPHGEFSFPKGLFKELSKGFCEEQTECYLKFVSNTDGWILVNPDKKEIKKKWNYFLVRFNKTAEQFIVAISLNDDEKKLNIKEGKEYWSITKTIFAKQYKMLGQIYGAFQFKAY